MRLLRNHLSFPDSFFHAQFIPCLLISFVQISSTPVCTSFDSMKNKGNPIVRVAVQPENPSELPQLERGLQLLYLADPAVATSVLENGELVVAALGELHLHRCLSMLTEDFAKIKFNVSPPIVSFRESVIASLSREHTQEFVQEIAERTVKITVRCRPLPLEITNYLEGNQDLTRRFIERAQGAADVEGFATVQSYRDELRALFGAAGPEWSSVFNSTSSKIWAFGPKRVGPNVLINSIPSFHTSPFWRSITESSVSVPLSLVDGAVVGDETASLSQETLKYFYALQQLDNGIRAGFQLATKAGPLCDEPMFGVAFEVLNVDFVDPTTESSAPQKRKTIKVDDDGFPISDDEDDEDSQTQADAAKKILDPTVVTKDNTSSLQWAETSALHQQTGRLSGFVISSMRQACREAFLRREQRLVEAMYLCAVQTNAEGAGKVYGFLSKRRAKILNEEMHEGSSIIVVMAFLPAAESFGFAEELFRKTSGAASAQLEFDHWGILDEDPNFVPTTEEELEEFGDNLGGIAPNLARKHIDAVRRRKVRFSAFRNVLNNNHLSQDCIHALSTARRLLHRWKKPCYSHFNLSSLLVTVPLLIFDFVAGLAGQGKESRRS
jgi:ribosome assembly protein 1